MPSTRRQSMSRGERTSTSLDIQKYAGWRTPSTLTNGLSLILSMRSTRHIMGLLGIMICKCITILSCLGTILKTSCTPCVCTLPQCLTFLVSKPLVMVELFESVYKALNCLRFLFLFYSLLLFLKVLPSCAHHFWWGHAAIPRCCASTMLIYSFVVDLVIVSYLCTEITKVIQKYIYSKIYFKKYKCIFMHFNIRTNIFTSIQYVVHRV